MLTKCYVQLNFKQKACQGILSVNSTTKFKYLHYLIAF